VAWPGPRDICLAILAIKAAVRLLSSEEATALLGNMDVSTVVGLRDRAIMRCM
jgi:site-specific recombinase XerD